MIVRGEGKFKPSLPIHEIKRNKGIPWCFYHFLFLLHLAPERTKAQLKLEYLFKFFYNACLHLLKDLRFNFSKDALNFTLSYKQNPIPIYFFDKNSYKTFTVQSNFKENYSKLGIKAKC